MSSGHPLHPRGPAFLLPRKRCERQASWLKSQTHVARKETLATCSPQLTLQGSGKGEGVHTQYLLPIPGHSQPHAGDKNSIFAAPSVLILRSRL